MVARNNSPEAFTAPESEVTERLEHPDRATRRRLPRLGLVFQRRRGFWIGVTLAFLLVAGAYAVAFQSFVHTRAERQGTAFGLTVPDGRVSVNAAVIGADPTAKQLSVRLSILPGNDMLSPAGVFKDFPLVVTVNSASGPASRRFEVGDRPETIDTTLAMTNGDVGDYPWDAYVARLLVSAYQLNSNDTVRKHFPVDVRFTSRPFGFTADAKTEPSDFSGTLVRLDVHRSSPVRLFGTFGFALILLLGLGAGVAGFSVIVERRLVEFPYLFFCATLLFSFPALRGALPGAPPIGALADYLAFFWGIGLVAVTLLALLVRLIIPPRVTRAEVETARLATESTPTKADEAPFDPTLDD